MVKLKGIEEHCGHSSASRHFVAIAFPVAIYILGFLVSLAGTITGCDHFMSPLPKSAAKRPLVERLVRWDGDAYRAIVADCYSYQPNRPSNIAYFPGYSLISSAIKFIFNTPVHVALVTASNTSLLMSLVIFSRYSRDGQRLSTTGADYALLALNVFPTTVFFRLAYSESTFLFFVLVGMWGIQRGWRPVWIALFIGLASGTRFVGIALLPPFLWYLWNQSPSRLRFWLSATPLSVLSLSGLLAFMLYQQIEFGDALAFAKTQADFAKHRTEFSLAEFGNLLIGKPIWATYVPGNPVSWLAHDNVYINPVFSLNFANPIYWLFAWVLIGIGVYRRWLTKYEVLLSAGLLLIPYLTVASMNGMRSQGRYAAVVFPCYIVMGKLLSSVDPVTRTIVCCAMAIGLFLYSAMFVAGYAIF